jgi:hypothetical protein
MRPPASTLLSKLGYSNLIVIAGFISGILITISVWLKLSNHFVTFLSLFSLGLIGLGEFFVCSKTSRNSSALDHHPGCACSGFPGLSFPGIIWPDLRRHAARFCLPFLPLRHLRRFCLRVELRKKHKEHCYCNEWDDTAAHGQTLFHPPLRQSSLAASGDKTAGVPVLSLDLNATEPQGLNVMISGSDQRNCIRLPCFSVHIHLLGAFPKEAGPQHLRPHPPQD